MFRVMVRQLLDDKAFREKRRITLIDFSDETGLSKNTISRLLNTPNYNGSFETLDVLCDYFDCQPGDILRHHPSDNES